MVSRRAAILAVVLVFGPSLAVPCHLPDYLRNMSDELTPQQLALLAMHSGSKEQIPYELAAPEACVGGSADIFSCDNIDLLSVTALADIGGGTGNDLWGWVDPVTGTEYALVGRSNGTAFLDLSDPANPVYVGNLPTHAAQSTWRDIKVYDDFAFIVADFAGNHGMQVFDLAELRGVTNPPVTFSETGHYPGLERAHNVVINEDTGFAYAVGSETCAGGLHMIDISVPIAPISAGCFSGDGYTHDAQCVAYHGPDPDYQGSEICFGSNEDTVTIIDVTDKSNPTMLSRTGYAGAEYTHQGWLTEDHQYFVHDDELDELFNGHNTRTYVWDVTNLDNPFLAGEFTNTGSAIDHNQYIQGSYSYQANYRRGLRILQIDDPATGALSEVAYFDTYPEGNGNSFEGAWSTYPFLPSGIVLVSDINRGLFVLQPNLGGSGGDTLNVIGDCPGDVTVEVTGQTANGRVSIFRSRNAGSTVLDGGRCSGTELGIVTPNRLASGSADANGDFSSTRTYSANRCGLFVQAIDLTTCEVSNVGLID